MLAGKALKKKPNRTDFAHTLEVNGIKRTFHFFQINYPTITLTLTLSNFSNCMSAPCVMERV